MHVFARRPSNAWKDSIAKSSNGKPLRFYATENELSLQSRA